MTDARVAIGVQALRYVYAKLKTSYTIAYEAHRRFKREGRETDAVWAQGRFRALEQAMACVELEALALRDPEFDAGEYLTRKGVMNANGA